MNTQVNENHCDIKNAAICEHVNCLIIGSGPAGYTAAIYAARANIKPVLYQGIQPGGQLTITTEIENFPGYSEGITGSEMMDDLRKQAARFGSDIRYGSVTKVDFQVYPFQVHIDDDHTVTASSVIIATGATAKYLGLESEDKYKGSGVSACATCDGFFYKGQDVAIVGGGDTACEEALYLSGLCNKVYMIVRKPALRASDIMQTRVMQKNNIKILFEHNTKEIYGEGGVEGVKLIKRKDKADEKEIDIKVAGFFLAIGHQPNSDIFKPYIETDEEGYIKVKKSTHTNIEGVFACGDVIDNSYRQAITAAASGCRAAIDAERWLIGKM